MPPRCLVAALLHPASTAIAVVGLLSSSLLLSHHGKGLGRQGGLTSPVVETGSSGLGMKPHAWQDLGQAKPGKVEAAVQQ